jgi:hypothetical protein
MIIKINDTFFLFCFFCLGNHKESRLKKKREKKKLAILVSPEISKKDKTVGTQERLTVVGELTYR